MGIIVAGKIEAGGLRIGEELIIFPNQVRQSACFEGTHDAPC